MYDANTLRRQIEESWANFIVHQTESRKERASRYKTKKIMIQAHGIEAYYEIDFPIEFISLSHSLTPLLEISPLDLILTSPMMIGGLGAVAQILGEVDKVEEEEVPEEEVMDEDMFFSQHFTSSLSDAVSGINKKKPGFGF